jgi:hypothetical protein
MQGIACGGTCAGAPWQEKGGKEDHCQKSSEEKNCEEEKKEKEEKNQ